MDRNLCYMSPIFDDSLRIGLRVKYIYRNRKMEVLAEGYGIIERNNKTTLMIQDEENEYPKGAIFVKAEDVYNGKHSLEVV